MERISNEADGFIRYVQDASDVVIGDDRVNSIPALTIPYIWKHITDNTTGKTSETGETGESFQKRVLIQQDIFIDILRKPLDDHVKLTRSKIRLMMSQIGNVGRPQRGPKDTNKKKEKETEDDFVKRLNAWKKPPQLADDILEKIGENFGNVSLKAENKKTKKKKKKKKKKSSKGAR